MGRGEERLPDRRRGALEGRVGRGEQVQRAPLSERDAVVVRPGRRLLREEDGRRVDPEPDLEAGLARRRDGPDEQRARERVRGDVARVEAEPVGVRRREDHRDVLGGRPFDLGEGKGRRAVGHVAEPVRTEVVNAPWRCRRADVHAGLDQDPRRDTADVRPNRERNARVGLAGALHDEVVEAEGARAHQVEAGFVEPVLADDLCRDHADSASRQSVHSSRAALTPGAPGPLRKIVRSPPPTGAVVETLIGPPGAASTARSRSVFWSCRELRHERDAHLAHRQTAICSNWPVTGLQGREDREGIADGGHVARPHAHDERPGEGGDTRTAPASECGPRRACRCARSVSTSITRRDTTGDGK